MSRPYRNRVILVALFVTTGGWASGEAPVSLESLLHELEQASSSEERDVVPESDETLRRALDNLITKRNEIIRREGGFFPFLNRTKQVESDYVRAHGNLFNAAAYHSQASANVAEQIRLSAMAGKESLGLGRAQAVLADASGKKRAAEQLAQRHSLSLQEHYQRMRRDGTAFFQSYQTLRRYLPHRRDSSNLTIADVVKQRGNESPDFVEGHIVAAVAYIYQGSDAEAMLLLESANEIFKRYPPLVGTTIAEDCCATWLLLGRPDKIGVFISSIESVDAKVRTASQEWLLAANAAIRGRADEANKKYSVAMRKAKVDASSALKAEAALAALEGAVTSGKIRRAREFLRGTEHESEWPVLQARAAIAAAEERWEEAILLLDEAAGLAPPCLESVFAEQRAAYKGGEPWIKKVQRR